MKKTIAMVVLALFLVSIPAGFGAKIITTGGSTGIKFEINETASNETTDDGSEDTDDNSEDETQDDDSSDEETSDDDSDDTSEDELEAYARDHIKEKEISVCKNRLLSEFPNTNTERIRNACQKHYLYVAGLSEVAPLRQVVASTATGFNRCVAFLNQNKTVDSAADICQKIIRREVKCVDYLTELGITNPERKCDAVFSLEAVKTLQAIPRIKNILVEKNPAALEKFNSLPAEAQRILVHLPASKQKNILSSENPAELVKNYTVSLVKAEDAFRKRVVESNIKEKAEKSYEEAKENFNRAEGLYKEKKEKFVELKKKVRDCKESASEECKKLNDETLQSAKEFLLNAADKAIEHLKKIEEKVKASDDLTEEEANDILLDISNAVSELESAKETVNAAATKEELAEAAKTINALWKKIRIRASIHAAKLVNAHLGEIIQRSGHLQEKLQCSLDTIPEGTDTTGVDALVQQFSSYIAEAHDKYNHAKELLESGNTPGDVKQALKDAQKDLQQAHSLLKDIVAEIKANGGQITPCPGTEDEVAVVTEGS